MTTTILLNPVEAARIGWRRARGLAFAEGFLFKRQDGTPQTGMATRSPQLVFLARSDTRALGYDIAITDDVNGIGSIDVPGIVLNDPLGYSVEMYSRNDQMQPDGLLAKGQLLYSGEAYRISGPHSPATYPTGPQGPTGAAGPAGAPGAAGAPGQRGSIWTTGAGAPSTTGAEIEGDMWLNETNGDVWRYTSGSWSRGTF